ncbi:hypothetical protein [Burkholderia sp. LMG 32019]|uniref:hypothetical protein n=1 Tax=Burkholderia sp. LMG 32019 TaxID=3158173 RepID=UPI003C2C8F40
MDELERLQAAIAEHKRRWTEKYGWHDAPREYPTMEEVMRRERELKETREANAYLRAYFENLHRSDDMGGVIEVSSIAECQTSPFNST